jgi:hypothetical protein
MRPLLLSVAVAAACGGSPRPQPAAQPHSGARPAARAPVAAAPPAQPTPDTDEAAATPPQPSGPVEVKIPAVQTTVKLVSDGKGKKQPLRYTARSGAKQAVEIAMDIWGKQDAEEDVEPTIVLLCQAETRAVDKDGSADVVLTVTGFDVRAVAGSSTPIDKFKAALGQLTGLTIGGKRGANGAAGEVTLRIENPPSHARDALELIRLTLPTLPVLPAQALGVGARWQSTSTVKFADKFDVTHITDYELVAHDGPAWTIKGATKVSGNDQEIENARFSAISGAGTSETTIADGTLMPAHKASLETRFSELDGDKSIKFAIKLASVVAPK